MVYAFHALVCVSRIVHNKINKVNRQTETDRQTDRQAAKIVRIIEREREDLGRLWMMEGEETEGKILCVCARALAVNEYNKRMIGCSSGPISNTEESSDKKHLLLRTAMLVQVYIRMLVYARTSNSNTTERRHSLFFF